MNKKQIEQTLRDKPGYLKYSYEKIRKLLFPKNTLNDIQEIVYNLRIEYYPRVPKKTFIAKGEPIKEKLYINTKYNNAGNTLVIGDTHFPFEKEGYLDHCLEIKSKYKCRNIIHIGDEIDNCAISQYVKDPDGFSAGTEAELAYKTIQQWYKAFPDVKVVIGNHSARIFRLAHDAGIPKRFMKSYEEIWNAPKGWRWAESWEVDNVHYTHGTGVSGPNAALKIAMQRRQSVAIGHIHTEATIQYNASTKDAIWGMLVGCGINDKQYAFHYAKENPKKSIVSCAVVLENGRLPIIELMPL